MALELAAGDATWILALMLAPDPLLLGVAVAVDLLVGDPVYPWHPVRLIGAALLAIERGLRAIGCDGYGGGIALCVLLCGLALGVVAIILAAAAMLSPWAALVVHGLILYSLLALGDLIHHVWRVERALVRDDLAGARLAVGGLVGRDTERMDAAACRRAAIESLSESLVDGFISPLLWYGLAGPAGLIVFKTVSTLDSMVGYRTERYLRFGWCGARLDDVMNYVPARFTWLMVAAVATSLPGCSGGKALSYGVRQYGLLPSPNSGWSEAATAGAIGRRLVGPVWRQGVLVTELWLGDPADPPAGTHADVVRATLVTLAVAFVTLALVEAMLVGLR